jgi:hypothetical protein
MAVALTVLDQIADQVNFTLTPFNSDDIATGAAIALAYSWFMAS